MSTKQIHKPISDIYKYDNQISGIFKKIEQELPNSTIDLIYKYDREMINTSKAKGTYTIRERWYSTAYPIR